MTDEEAAVISRATGQTSVPVRKKEHMGLRDILVHIDNRKPCPVRLRAAIDLALAPWWPVSAKLHPYDGVARFPARSAPRS